MLVPFLFPPLLLFASAFAGPTRPKEKRQEAPPVTGGNGLLNQTLGDLQGIIGQNLTFDYIVVGAGTAGLAIATRLAQKYTVAVIEAGTFYEATDPLLA